MTCRQKRRDAARPLGKSRLALVSCRDAENEGTEGDHAKGIPGHHQGAGRLARCKGECYKGRDMAPCLLSGVPAEEFIKETEVHICLIWFRRSPAGRLEGRLASR